MSDYSKTAKQQNPGFIPPRRHRKRPSPLLAWQERARQRKLHLWLGFLKLIASGERKRGFRPEMQKALAALTQGMLHYVNIATHHVQASVTELADRCGLSTISPTGKKSVSRVSRLLSILEKAGVVKTRNEWDSNERKFLPKYIELQPAFFSMIGVRLCDVKKQQVKFQKNAQKELLGREIGYDLSIAELKKQSMSLHFAKSKIWRLKKACSPNASKIQALITESKAHWGYHKLDNKIAMDELSRMSLQQIKAISPADLRHLVNQRKSYLGKVFS